MSSVFLFGSPEWTIRFVGFNTDNSGMAVLLGMVIMTETVSLLEFWGMLARADWYYEASDDHSVWQAGVESFRKLEEIAKQSSKHTKLYQRFGDHYFSGKPWGTKQAPLPRKPKS